MYNNLFHANAIQRQLGVSFFNGKEGDDATDEKRNFTPLTNLRSESEFGTIDNNFKHPGGGTNLKTVCESEFGTIGNNFKHPGGGTNLKTVCESEFGTVGNNFNHPGGGTNLKTVCESEFGTIGNNFKHPGGGTNLKTVCESEFGTVGNNFDHPGGGTNLKTVCESEFGTIGNNFKHPGGGTNLKTVCESEFGTVGNNFDHPGGGTNLKTVCESEFGTIGNNFKPPGGGTNLKTVCESEFGTVGNDFKHPGDGTSLKTVSYKHVVSRNALFENNRWNQLDEQQKRAKWKWASNSAEAKNVGQMEKDFVEGVGAVEKLALAGKREQKKKIHQKLTKNIEECKIHGGPLAHKNVDKIHSFTYDQVKLEAGFLKKTTAPNMRYKRKIRNNFVNFTIGEL